MSWWHTSDIHQQYFAGAVPSERQGILDAPADQQGSSIRMVEAQAVPSIEECPWIESSAVLVENELTAMKVPAESQMVRVAGCGRMMCA